MATDFLNDARREIEGRTEDFYGELKAFYQGNAKAEPDGTDDTALLAEPLLKWEKITAAGPDGGYGDAGTGAAGGLRWPEKGRL